MKNKIGFVFGAGVSFEYGYPLGNQLKNSIIESIRSKMVNVHSRDMYLASGPLKARARTLFAEINYNQSEIDEFCNKLDKFEGDSIDRFLESHTEYTDIGKIFISLILLYCESLNKKLYDYNKTKVYKYLMSKLFPTEASLLKIPMYYFISFNYDISFEAYFCHYLKYHFNLSEDIVRKCYELLKIYHVYGSLMKFDYGITFTQRNTDEIGFRQYGTIDKEIVHKCAESIKVVPEDRAADDESLIEIQNIVQNELSHLFCLGFGYDYTNLKRIGVLDISRRDIKDYTPRICGSTLNITNTVAEIKFKKFNNSNFVDKELLKNFNSNHTSLEFLDNNREFINLFPW